MIKHVLVPVDGSVHANKAVALASDMAEKFGARLTLLHVMAHAGGERVPEELRAYAEIENMRITEHDILQSAANEILETAALVARDHGVGKPQTVCKVGAPARQIIDYVSGANVDLVVVGRRGLGELGELLLGSVSHKVGQLAPCTCVTVT